MDSLLGDVCVVSVSEGSIETGKETNIERLAVSWQAGGCLECCGDGAGTEDVRRTRAGADPDCVGSP